MRSPWRGPIRAFVVVVALVALPLAATTPASAAPPAAGALKINEDESNGGSPGDFVELINNGATAGDIGGYVIRDNDDTHTYTIPAGTTIAAGGYYVVEIDTVPGGFGLGSADSARLFAPGGVDLLDTHSWTAHAATTYGRCPNGTGPFTTTTSSTKGAANDCGIATPNVKINEVESTDPSVADFIEIVNNGAAPAAVGGYVLKDSDDTHVFTIPAGTTIAAGGYYVADVDVTGGFGLGSADAARLFTPGAAALVDTYSWSAHAATTYGRCPDGTGPFTTTTAPTRGAKNSCPGDIVVSPWPGGSAVATADGVNVFATNLSGLAYQPSGTRERGVLWAVRNSPSTLYRLVWDGAKWTPDPTNGWGAGKALRYPNGGGDPDAEGVTLVDNDPANGIFVSTERDNNVGSTSRPAVLRFDVSSSATTLNATTDWNLTPDLPGLGPNLGAEAVEWIPDSFLVSKGMRDESTSAPYNPSTYADHGSGLFFVGVEQGGPIIAYALNQTTATYSRVATIASGFTGVMDLEFEPETSHLWAVCDDTCNGRSATLDIAQTGANAGRFVVTNTYDRPAGMANLNNEGFAIAPQRECVDGFKPVFWSDDNNTDQHALRSGTLNCTVIVDPQATSLTQTPVSVLGALFSFRITYAAVLRSQVTGLPLAGRTVSFSTTSSSSGPAACTGLTNAGGRATCTTGFVSPLILRDAGTVARFAGADDYAPTTDTTPFQRA